MSEPKPIALVIGDVMLDRRTEGEMSRVSLEAPAPVVHVNAITESLGGAGNIARNIVALGHQAMLMGVIGPDSDGERIKHLAAAGGIPFCHSCTGPDSPTIVKHRVTSGGKIVLRIDHELKPMTQEAGLLVGFDGLGQMASQIKVIVIGDYGKGAMTPLVMERVRQFSAEHGIPIFVDARPETMHLYQSVSLLKPNMREALGMLSDDVHPGLAMESDRAYVAASQLRKKYQAGVVFVTDGPRGCAYTDPLDDNRVHGLDAFGPHGLDIVRDICGAGDTTMAALAVGLMEGKDIAISAQFAMQAAGYVVQFYGVHQADRDGVEDFIYTHSGGYKKLMTEEKMLEFVARQRRMDERVQIVLTNGCFDGFHAGQLETLRFAKRQGDILIVAYNDDESLRELKGTDRPHVPDSYRSSHLAAQEPVDVVFRFNGDVERIVRKIKPDVLVKGQDAAAAPIPGADYVAQHGGRVELCPTDTFYVTVDRGRTFSPPEGSDPAESEG